MNFVSRFHIPNLITLARILAVPLAIWLMVGGRYDLAFWVFSVAAISDALDGFLAKRFDAVTTMGGFLDPIADKLLLVSVYVTLGIQDKMESWLVILVVFRDVLIIGGALLFETVTHALTMEPLMISKINTVVQIGLGLAVLSHISGGPVDGWLIAPLTVTVAVTTVVSGGLYVFKWGAKASGLTEEER